MRDKLQWKPAVLNSVRGLSLALLIAAPMFGQELLPDDAHVTGHVATSGETAPCSAASATSRIAATKIASAELRADEFEALMTQQVVGGSRLSDVVNSHHAASNRAAFPSRSRMSITADGLEYEAFSLLETSSSSYKGLLIYSPIPANVRKELASANVDVPWSAMIVESGSTPQSVRIEMVGQGPAQEIDFSDAGDPQISAGGVGVRANASDGCITCIRQQINAIACEAAAIAISCATGIGCPGSVMALIVKATIGETTSITCSQLQIAACAVQCSLPSISLSPGSNTTFAPSTIPIQVSVSGGGIQAGTWIAVLRGLEVVALDLGFGSSDVYNWTATAGTYRIIAGNIPLPSGLPWLKSSSNVVVRSANVAPTVNFSFTTSGLTASFVDSSRDSDGSIVARSWSFGDGTTSAATNPTKTYTTSGTRLVTLTVTDNGGLTASVAKYVTVSQTTSSCTGSLYTGTLAQGAGVAQPNGTYYYSGISGTHTARLIGPTGTNFNLFLYHWNGSGWVQVASGTSSGSNEYISYYGSAGYYYWAIIAYQGSGGYSLCITRP